MKKGLIIFLAVLAAAVLCLALLLRWLSVRPVVSDDYMEKIKSGGDLEARYLATGPCEVSYLERSGMHDFKKYEIFYPAAISEGSGRWPVVIYSNGTGIQGSKYRAAQRRLASWGFIVMATEEENSWYGFSSEMCLRTILQADETETIDGWDVNPFYGHVDRDAIGVSGHSQGGVGVINAATESRNGVLVKAVFSASPTNPALADALQWDYDPSELRVPVFFVSATGDSDEKLVVSGTQLREVYDAVPDTVMKVMARRKDAEHGDMLTSADGYMTAWFLWLLRGDEEAAKVFTGNDPEILRNALYQDQAVSLP